MRNKNKKLIESFFTLNIFLYESNINLFQSHFKVYINIIVFSEAVFLRVFTDTLLVEYLRVLTGKKIT